MLLIHPRTRLLFLLLSREIPAKHMYGELLFEISSKNEGANGGTLS